MGLLIEGRGGAHGNSRQGQRGKGKGLWTGSALKLKCCRPWAHDGPRRWLWQATAHGRANVGACNKGILLLPVAARHACPHRMACILMHVLTHTRGWRSSALTRTGFALHAMTRARLVCAERLLLHGGGHAQNARTQKAFWSCRRYRRTSDALTARQHPRQTYATISHLPRPCIIMAMVRQTLARH